MYIDRIKFSTELIRQDLTQTKLSEMTGLSRTTINNVKFGRKCSEKVAGKIATALNVPVEKLLEK